MPYASRRLRNILAVSTLIIICAAGLFMSLRSGKPVPRIVVERVAPAKSETAPADSAVGKSSTDPLSSGDLTPLPEEESDANVGAVKVDADLTRKRQHDYWRKEDEVFVKMPKYEDVRDQYRKIAEERLAGIDSKDSEAVLALAQGEIEAFWNEGALLEQKAYECGFLAAAIMEIACERKPDDFRLLGELKEALATVSPIARVIKSISIMDSYKRLWPVVEKRYNLVLSGRVTLSGEAMAAVKDYADFAPLMKLDVYAATPAWQWIVDNAEGGGWSNYRELFEKALESSKQGDSFGIGLAVGVTPPGVDIMRSSDARAKTTLIWAKYGRRLSSLVGSKEFQRHYVPLWECKDNITIRTTVVGPEP